VGIAADSIGVGTSVVVGGGTGIGVGSNTETRAGVSTVKETKRSTKALAGVAGDCWTTFIRLSAWMIVMLEKAVMSGTKTLAGVVIDDWTT